MGNRHLGLSNRRRRRRGRPRSVDLGSFYAHRPGRSRTAAMRDHANDHYHLYKDDVQLMKALGAKAYRFSIAWPRVFPEGTGSPNPKGLDFYNRLLDELLANGIEPFATMYHWDLPQALQDRLRRLDVARHLEGVCRLCGLRRRASQRSREAYLHDQRMFEAGSSRPWSSALDAPGLKLPQSELNQVRHHVALGHGLAVQAIRAHGRAGTKVGPRREHRQSASPRSKRRRTFARRKSPRAKLNAGYLTVMLEGKYTEAYLAQAGKDAPKFTAEDLRIISSPIDFVGLNVYTPRSLRRCG